MTSPATATPQAAITFYHSGPTGCRTPLILSPTFPQPDTEIYTRLFDAFVVGEDFTADPPGRYEPFSLGEVTAILITYRGHPSPPYPEGALFYPLWIYFSDRTYDLSLPVNREELPLIRAQLATAVAERQIRAFSDGVRRTVFFDLSKVKSIIITKESDREQIYPIDP